MFININYDLVRLNMSYDDFELWKRVINDCKKNLWIKTSIQYTRDIDYKRPWLFYTEYIYMLLYCKDFKSDLSTQDKRSFKEYVDRDLRYIKVNKNLSKSDKLYYKLCILMDYHLSRLSTHSTLTVIGNYLYLSNGLRHFRVVLKDISIILDTSYIGSSDCTDNIMCIQYQLVNNIYSPKCLYFSFLDGKCVCDENFGTLLEAEELSDTVYKRVMLFN